MLSDHNPGPKLKSCQNNDRRSQKLKRSDRRIYSMSRDRGDTLWGKVYPENSPDNFAATVTQNGGRNRAVNPLQPRLAAKRIQGSRGGEAPHTIHWGTREAQTSSPQTARATVRSGTLTNVAWCGALGPQSRPEV
ncbi:hypothetical protein NDU88_001284 [Pleurodeles waltl]|uniref:Uncharacterized protein n=1 Tax=Pleurodeles waltl TaxID=8319 RepID=A0AAV7VYI2_PLEWA|nr:hypothetical protein NDU88_001284 [Pleurodeles waltl]